MNWKYKSANAESNDASEAYETPLIINTSVPTAGGSVTRVIENDVYFYGDISEQNALELNSILYEVDKKLQVAGLFVNSIPTINLHINSYGGSLFAGLATVDVIRGLKCNVNSYVEGAAASAATIISVSCDQRYIGRYSKMLIHQLTAGAYGKYNELEDDMENNKHLMETIKAIYKKYTKVPMSKLNEILKHDLWFDSEKCKDLGLIDHII